MIIIGLYNMYPLFFVTIFYVLSYFLAFQFLYNSNNLNIWLDISSRNELILGRAIVSRHCMSGQESSHARAGTMGCDRPISCYCF